jgi:alkaline phosphatase
LSAIQKSKGKALKWEDVKSIISENTSLYTNVELSTEEDELLQNSFARMMRHQEQLKTLYKDINKLAADALGILNQKSRLGWTTNGHTASAVPVFAIGVGAENFTGWHDNSEIAPLIYQATQSPRK